MIARHRAFGLDVEATFPLAELPEHPGGAPADVVLRLIGAPEAMALWSGPADPPRRAEAFIDGTSYFVERGTGGDLLMRWGEAVFHLAPDDATLHCAPNADDPRWRRLLLDTVLATVSMRQGFQLVHAGAVLTADGLVAVIAGTGGGKTTLVAELCRRGGSLFCDDLLAVPDTDALLCEPGPPLMNMAIDGAVDPAAVGEEIARLGDEVWISNPRHCTAPEPLAAFVLLERTGAANSPELSPLEAPHLVLMASALDTGSDPEQRKLRFRVMSDLAATTPGLRLRAPLDAAPEALARLAEQAPAAGARA